jgi:hypothetical protein
MGVLTVSEWARPGGNGELAFGWKGLKRFKRSGSKRCRTAEVTEANKGYRNKMGYEEQTWVQKANKGYRSKHQSLSGKDCC